MCAIFVGDHPEVARPRKQTTQDIHQRACSCETATDPRLCQLLPAGKRQVYCDKTEQGPPQDTGGDPRVFQQSLFQFEGSRGDVDCATAT